MSKISHKEAQKVNPYQDLNVKKPEAFPVSNTLNTMKKERSFKLKRECPPYRQSLEQVQQHAEELKAAAEKPMDETQTIRTEIEEFGEPVSPPDFTIVDQQTIEENIRIINTNRGGMHDTLKTI